MVLWTSHHSVPQCCDSAGCLKHSCLPAWTDGVSIKELLRWNWISSKWWAILTSISRDTSSLHVICLPLRAKKIARNEMLYSGFGNKTAGGKETSWSWQAGLALSGLQQTERVREDVTCRPLSLPWYALLASCHLPSWCSAQAPRSHRAAAGFGAGGFPTAAPVPAASLVAPESVPAAPTHSAQLVRPHQTAPCWKNAASPEIANHTTSDYSPHPLKNTLITLSR